MLETPAGKGSSARLEPFQRLHTYCARFPSEIAEAAIDQFTKRGESVFDPFCGSGTSLVAGLLRGRKVIGADIDVLAGMLSAVKCSPLSPNQYARWRPQFVARLEELFDQIQCSWPPQGRPLPGSTLRIGGLRLLVPAFARLNYWFPPQLVAFLAAISHAAQGCRNEHYEKVALTSLSAAIIAKWPNTLSYAMDVDHTRPHKRLQRFGRRKVFDAYLKRLDRSIECLGSLHQAYLEAGAIPSLADSVSIKCPQDARLPIPGPPR